MARRYEATADSQNDEVPKSKSIGFKLGVAGIALASVAACGAQANGQAPVPKHTTTATTPDSPSLAPSPTAEVDPTIQATAQQTAETFLNAYIQGDAQKSYAYTDTTFRSAASFASWQKQVDKYSSFVRTGDSLKLESTTNTDVLAEVADIGIEGLPVESLRYLIEGTDNNYLITVATVERNQKWFLSGFNVATTDLTK